MMVVPAAGAPTGRSDTGRLMRWTSAVTLAYFAGSELGYAVSLGPSVGGTFWPPAGILLAFLLAAPAGTVPWLLAGAAAANYLSDLLHGQSLPASVGFAVANLGEPLLGAVVIRRLLGTPVTFSRLHDVAVLAFVAVCVSAPLAAAVGAAFAAVYTDSPPGFAVGWRTWWVGDAVGALVLTPFVLRVLTDWRQLPAVRTRTWIEAAGFAAVVFTVTQIVFRAPPTSMAVPFLVFPVLIWGSVRLGIIAVGAALCLIVLLTAHDTAMGLGPFAAATLSLGDRLIALQIYVGVMALSFHGLAALWEERARTTAALRAAHSGLAARHQRIVEQSPLAIAVVQPDGTVADANPAWRHLRARDGIHGHQPWHDPELVPLMARAFTGEVVELPDHEIATTNAPASRRRVRGFAYPVKDEQGGVAEVVVIERDITEEVAAREQLVETNRALREREEALSHALHEMAEAQAHREQLLAAERSARDEAERASQLKDEFLATLSHELRTPLNAIVGWAHILRQNAEAPSPAIEAISRNAQAQAALIEDLLDMSRIMAGKVDLNLGRVRLDDVVASAVVALEPLARARRVSLSAATDGAADVWISADTARLQQVLTNLIDNGIKFTPAGGLVELRVDVQAHEARIVVRDTGQGIHPDFLPSVFDRFRQADGSTTRRHGGLGIGLSIARQIVIMHGGTIHAHSDGAGRGAAFTVTLPLAGEAIAPQASAAPADGASGSLAGLRLVVADDNHDARELLRRLFTHHGATVVCASSADEAFQAIDGQPCDVLLTDIGMPGTDGYELLRRVRAGGYAGLSVVAVTAFARPEDRERAIAAGFDGHVPKPVDHAHLLQLVGRLAGSSARGRSDDPSRNALA